MTSVAIAFISINKWSATECSYCTSQSTGKRGESLKIANSETNQFLSIEKL